MSEDSTGCRTSFVMLKVMACWRSATFKTCEIMDVEEPRMFPHAFGIDGCAVPNAGKDRLHSSDRRVPPTYIAGPI